MEVRITVMDGGGWSCASAAVRSGDSGGGVPEDGGAQQIGTRRRCREEPRGAGQGCWGTIEGAIPRTAGPIRWGWRRKF